MDKQFPTLTAKDRYGSITRHKAPEELFPPHHHEHLEINLIETGHAKYNVNERIYKLEPRCLVFLFPAQEHMLYDRSPDFKMWNITVRQSFLNTFCQNHYLQPLKARDPETYFCRQLHPAMFLLYEQLLPEIAEQRCERPIIFRIGLSYLIASIWKDFQENTSAVTHSPVSPHVQRAVHMLSHAEAPEDLGTLAKRLNTSPSQISRMFKREMGISITDFRNRQKLDLFTKLLYQNPQHDLLTLAMDADFGSYTQFFRIFRREMGMTPEQFRKKTVRQARPELKKTLHASE